MERENGSHADQAKFEVKPLNPVGFWIENMRASRGMSVDKVAEIIGLPGLRALRRSEPAGLSLYTIEKVLQGGDPKYGLNYTPDEIDSLADAASEIVSIRMEKKGNLYDRVPPSIPKMAAQDVIGMTAYSDREFARHILGENADPVSLKRLSARIHIRRKDGGIPPVFSEVQGKCIQAEIEESDRRRGLK